MGDTASHGVALGRTQEPPLSVPSEIFSVYQAELGHVATIVWLNLRWAAHRGTSFSTGDARSLGIRVDEDELLHALQLLRDYELLEDAPDGQWIVHDPLPKALFQMRFGNSKADLTSVNSKNGSDTVDESSLEPAPKPPANDKGRSESSRRIMRSPLSKKRNQTRMLKLVDETVDRDEPINEDMQAVVQIYHKRIGMMGPTQFERLRFWVEEQGMEGAVVALAIEETVASAEVPRISYLEGILRNWYNDGIRTLAHVQQSKRASKVFFDSGDAGSSGKHEGAPNASAYQSVNPELVAKWKELYPDEYDS